MSIERNEKYCPKCNSTKLVIDFYQRDGYPTSYCKPCHRQYVRSGRAVIRGRIRALLTEAKDRPCMDCGEKHPSWAMDFDHREPATKLFDLGLASRMCLSDATILEEIAKCDVVCALCHRYRTHGTRRFSTMS